MASASRITLCDTKRCGWVYCLSEEFSTFETTAASIFDHNLAILKTLNTCCGSIQAEWKRREREKERRGGGVRKKAIELMTNYESIRQICRQIDVDKLLFIDSLKRSRFSGKFCLLWARQIDFNGSCAPIVGLPVI